MKFTRVICLLLIITIPTTSNAMLFGLIKDSVQAHNALIDAVNVGNTNYVKQLIAKGYPINGLDSEGQTALIKASLRGNQEITKLLLDAGANINAQDKAGNTALHYAAAHDHIAVSDELLKHGAQTNLVNKEGKTALQEALESKSINVAKLIDPASLVAVESEAFLAIPVAAAAGISGKTIAVAAGVAAAGGGAAVAAGGGGGGGGGGSSSPSPAPNPDPNPNPNPPANNPPVHNPPTPVATDIPGNPSSYEGYEYHNSRSDYSALGAGNPTVNNGLGAIHASAAYARGYSGAGVTVAVVDTGVDLTHPDLQANILSSGSDFVNNDSSAQDDNGHGSHVAGIIAAVRGNNVFINDGTSTYATNLNMQGVAYGVKILPVKVIDSSGSGSSVDIASGVNYARTQGAKIINLSLGGITITGSDPFPEITTAIKTSMQNNIMVFAAAGNSGGADPIWPARNAANLNGDGTGGTVATGAIIAVASVDANNNISSFSNRCGIAMNWCLVAPGENIHSTYWNGGSGYAVLDGTSMATPFVSGAAAILLQRFPASNPRLIALKLLNTATDLGAAGVDSVYGHGMLNLDAATDPAGTLSVPAGSSIGSGGSGGISSSSIVLSSAFGGALNNSNIEFMALDSYNFNYTMNLNNVTSSNISRTQSSDMFENFAEPVMSKIHMANIGDNLSLGFGSEDSKKLPDQAGQVQGQTTYFSMVSEAGGIKQAVNYNVPVAEYFSFGAVKNLNGSMFFGDATRGNPYLGLSSGGISSVSSFAFEDGSIQTNFAMFDGTNEKSGYGTSGFVSEVSANLDRFAVSSQFGSISEKDSFLGSHSSGAFAMGGSETPTWFYNLSGSLNISKNTKLFGIFSEGITSPEDASGSLVNSISQIRSRSFAGGVMTNDNFLEDDTIGFSVSSPLHVTSGSAMVDVPNGLDANGNIYRSNQSLNLAPSAVETDLEMFYKVPVNLGNFSVGAMRRLKPDNIEDAVTEDLVMFKYINKF